MTGSSSQFAIFRITLGVFLAVHFLALLPYVEEIYSSRGMYPLEFQSPFFGVFGILQSRTQIGGFFVGLALTAVLFAAGCHRRVLAIVLWFGWASLTNRLPFLYIPSEGLVGWLLLLSAVVPSGEAWSVRPLSISNWKISQSYIFAVWIVLGMGYFASGIDKLESPSWRMGTAIQSVLTSPIANFDWPAKAVRQLPLCVVQAMSWTVVAAEITFVFLIWHRWTRLVGWLMLSGMHMCIRVSLDLHTISDPFLIAHLLIFDTRWIAPFARRS
jgi:hypothetical protein